MKFTEQEKEQFLKEGYFVKSGVYSEAAMAPIKDAICRMVDEKARELHAEGVLDTLFEDEGFERRLARIHAHCPEAGKAIVRHTGEGRYSGPEMLAMLRHAPLIECLQSLIGPDIVGSSVYRIRPKVPHSNKGEVPWHQDSGYLLKHCDQHFIVTCWIPLVEATVESGCLYVIPKVHHDGIIRHHTGGNANFLVITEDDLPMPEQAVPVEMYAGDVLFMTNLTPHASFANTTDYVRWSLDLRYQGTEVPNNVGEVPEDYTPERDPVTMACYPPEADFVIKDSQDPSNEVNSSEAFSALRQRFWENKPNKPGRWTPVT